VSTVLFNEVSHKFSYTDPFSLVGWIFIAFYGNIHGKLGAKKKIIILVFVSQDFTVLTLPTIMALKSPPPPDSCVKTFCYKFQNASWGGGEIK